MQISRFLLLLFIGLLPLAVFGKGTVKDSTLASIEQLKDPKKQVDAYIDAIEMAWRIGNYKTGLLYANNALVLAKKNHLRKGEATVLNNIGIIYDYKGDYAKSLRYYYKALGIQESINDQYGIAYTCSNIGLIYSNQGDYDKAIRFHKRSLAIRKKIKSLSGISASYNNMGIVYMYQKNYQLALKNYLESVKMDKALGDETGLGDSYSNIGITYMDLKNYKQAEHYFMLSIVIRQKMNDQLGIANSYNNLGTLYEKTGDLQKAKLSLNRSIAIGKEIGSKEMIKYGYQILFVVEERLGNVAESYRCYKQFISYRESLVNEEMTRQQTKSEMQYQFDKKEAKKELERQQKELSDKKSREQVQFILWSVIVLAIIILFFSISLFKRWKIVKAQKVVIEEKNRLVELKNREILDSISYAKRIQSAILPPEKLVKEFLINSFILYKPKDIVAGDFYWMEAQGDTIIFAAADCTGHGVPGALISVVCHNALNRSVREFGLIEPGTILDKTREIIIEEFAKSEDDVNDGMDISLCSLNIETLELKWSGANNPLWIVRKSSNEVEEWKANKQPIGKYSKYESFQTHHLQLRKGDAIYLFTDGFADQFGGIDSKKYKSKNMKELILRVKDASMEEQKRLFDQVFEDWKGDLEQVDDVCVLGIMV